MRRSLIVSATTVVLAFASVNAGAAVAAPALSPTQLVSVSKTPPKEGDAAVFHYQSAPSISADGRYVAFASNATDLTDIRSSHLQVYLRDTVLGTTRMVSSIGGMEGNENSESPSVSDDGSVVAYLSKATNLGVRGGHYQGMIWTATLGTSQVATLNYDPIPVGINDVVNQIQLSGDGRTIVYATNATDAAPVTTNHVSQVYRRELGGATTLVSTDRNRGPNVGGDAPASEPKISQDGTWVSFSSRAQLSSMDTRGFNQIYLANSHTGSMEIISVDATGTMSGVGNSRSPSISADARHIAFSSTAQLTTVEVNSESQIYVRDRQSGITRLASANVQGVRTSTTGHAYYPVISGDGSRLVFTSNAVDLVPGDDPARRGEEVYLRDLRSGRASLLSTTVTGMGFANGTNDYPALSRNGAAAIWMSNATDLAAGATSGINQIYLRQTAELPRVERIGGADRFAVSAATSFNSFAVNTRVVYVASGEVFPDALSGSAAAGQARGPVLLVTKAGIPDAVVDELTRLRPDRIYVLGGPNTVGDGVMAALGEYATQVERIGGTDRFAVSASVSAEAFAGGSDTVYVASGEAFPDALSGSAAAGAFHAPVLLVSRTGVPPVVLEEAKRLQPTNIVVLGGINTVSEAVVTALEEVAKTTRVSATDRFALSASISRSTFTTSPVHTVYISSGAVFPDALSGAAGAIENRSPVLLVTRDSIPTDVVTELERLDPTRIVVLGGPNTVSEAVLADLDRFLTR